jgi:hypothetical protein
VHDLEPLRFILLIVHLLALAAIIGTYLMQFQLRSGFELRVILVGACVQFVSGLGLVVVRTLTEPDLRLGGAIGKAIVTTALLVVVIVAVVKQSTARRERRTDAGVRPLLHAAGAGAVVSLAIAVLAA